MGFLSIDAATGATTTRDLTSEEVADLDAIEAALAVAVPAGFVSRARAVDIEAQVLSHGKGGRIGTGGKVPVAFRLDDYQDAMLANNIVQKFSTRAMPCSIALCTNFGTQAWNQNVTWANIRTWTEQHGAEVWSHGIDHVSPDNTKAGIDAQVLDSKAAIEAEGLRCMGWTMPGVPDPGYGTTLDTFEDYHTTYAGQLIRETYALSESDVSSWFRPLPSGLRVGLGHYTISDGPTLADCQATLDTAIAYGRGIEFMLHPGNFGQPGHMTLANLDTFLDYVQAKVAAGLAVVVAPSSMPFCDPGSDRWLNVLADGRFAAAVTGQSSGSGVWRNLNTTTRKLATATRHDSTEGNVLEFSGAEGVISAQQLASVKNDGFAGQPLRFTGWARAIDAGDGLLARGRFRAETIAGDGPYTFVFDKNVISLSSSWAKYEYVFTPPPWANALNFSIGKGFGGTGDALQWDDVSVRPA